MAQSIEIRVNGKLKGLPPSNTAVEEAMVKLFDELNSDLHEITIEVRTTSYPDPIVEPEDEAPEGPDNLPQGICSGCGGVIYFDADDDNWYHREPPLPANAHPASPEQTDLCITCGGEIKFVNRGGRSGRARSGWIHTSEEAYDHPAAPANLDN